MDALVTLLELRANSEAGVDALVTLLDLRGNSEAGVTEQRDLVRPAFSQTAAPLLQGAVLLKAARLR